ncbi:MAG: PD40 domain-containing protein [Planctomycetes bacterium]|nr:PD40 domain-containing protein [Planctomycetota bacterium]
MVRPGPVLILIAFLAPESASAQATSRASLTSLGGEANSFSEHGSLSANGRKLAFMSLADNLALGDTNGEFDVFVRDLDTGITTIASVGPLGVNGDGPSGYPAISADGNFVAFESLATNLVPGDTNGKRDVFVRDLVAGVTERVSVSTGGGQSDDVATFWTTPAISSNGRYVAFESQAPNLVAIDTNNLPDVYLRDRLLGTTVRVSEAVQLPPAMPPPPYIESNSSSGRPAMTPDGRFIVYQSAASNLFAPSDDTNGVNDVYLRDTLLGTTTLVSRSSGGAVGNGPSGVPSISADGNFIAFDSSATNLVAGDTNGWGDVFLRNRATNTTTRVSVATGGAQGNRLSNGPAISGDGRFIAFRSLATNLILIDANESPDVYVHNRLTGVTRRVSVNSQNLEGNDYSVWPSLSNTGRYIAYYSLASNLVPNDLNQSSDVFIQDQDIASAFTPFCFGDGSGTGCPCGNSGGPQRGCANSTVASTGALLTGLGNASITVDTVVLTATGVTGPTLFFQGTGVITGGLGMVFGDGLLCAGGTIVRLGIAFPIGVTATFPAAPGTLHTTGMVVAPGARTYQGWYRDSLDFCTAATFNLTQGLSTIWAP